jgi:L-ribulokinase
MQAYADVIGMPISVIASDQGPALGSAIHAAVAAGAHPDIYAAASAMGGLGATVYVPDAQRAGAYDELYALYGRAHDYFGVQERQLMRELQALRERAASDGRNGRPAGDSFRQTPVPPMPEELGSAV